MAVRIVYDKNAHTARSAIASFAAVPNIPNVPVKVVDTTSGPVTLLQKVKGYYNQIVVGLGVVTMILSQVGPLAQLLPEDQRKYYTMALGFVTTVSALLVKNQQWVNDL